MMDIFLNTVAWFIVGVVGILFVILAVMAVTNRIIRTVLAWIAVFLAIMWAFGRVFPG